MSTLSTALAAVSQAAPISPNIFLRHSTWSLEVNIIQYNTTAYLYEGKIWITSNWIWGGHYFNGFGF